MAHGTGTPQTEPGVSDHEYGREGQGGFDWRVSAIKSHTGTPWAAAGGDQLALLGVWDSG